MTEGCSTALRFIQSRKMFPDLAHYIEVRAWGDLREAILVHAASGGYLHHFDIDALIASIRDPLTY